MTAEEMFKKTLDSFKDLTICQEPRLVSYDTVVRITELHHNSIIIKSPRFRSGYKPTYVMYRFHKCEKFIKIIDTLVTQDITILYTETDTGDISARKKIILHFEYSTDVRTDILSRYSLDALQNYLLRCWNTEQKK